MDHFLCYSLSKVAPSDDVWYSTRKVQTNPLHSIVKQICAQAGIERQKTNHSLRATAVTQLYEAGVPEKLIQEHTGHRSLNTLREYNRTTTNQSLSSCMHGLYRNVHTQTHCNRSDSLILRVNSLSTFAWQTNIAPSTSGSTGRVSVESITTADEFMDKVLPSTALPFLDKL